MEAIAVSPEMATAYLTLPPESVRHSSMPRLYPISVEKYHAMIKAGIITENDRCELVEGLLVAKMGKNRLHSYVTSWLICWLHEREANNWFADSQEPITTLESEPEPDVGDSRSPRGLSYGTSLTRPGLATGRSGGVVTDLIDKQVEVYTQPSGPAANPDYGNRQVFSLQEHMEVVIEGESVGVISVQDMFPKL